MRTAQKPKGTFSQRLAELRQARGLTQGEFARSMGVTRDVVAYYETRATNPTSEFVRKAADLLGVPADQLLNPAVKRTKPGPSSRLERQLELVRRLPKKQQDAVATVLDMALKNALQAGG